jgi:hypothetical protein
MRQEFMVIPPAGVTRADMHGGVDQPRHRGVHLRRVIAEGLFHADHTLSGAPPHD